MNTLVKDSDSLAKAKALVESIESGNAAGASNALDSLLEHHESEMFQELGRMTRDLHEALNACQLDVRLSELASKDIPDATERLTYVMTMTEDAAHRTLGAVEAALPVSELLERQGRQLQDRWSALSAEQVNAVNGISTDIQAFLDSTVTGAACISGNLSDVLMAQEYQDITGQVISKVITMVKSVESNLVELVRISGRRLGQLPEDNKPASGIRAHGPQVPGVDDSEGVVSGQDDVDDLLSSLGF